MASRIGSAMNRLFVGNIPWTVGKNELKQYFSQFGEIRGTQILFNRETGLTKGYGFVQFANSDAANAAIAKNIHELEGNELTVRFADNDRFQSQV